jgi:hypothetical protein
MRSNLTALLFATGLSLSGFAMAANPLTSTQLMKAAQVALSANAAADPEMANSTSGFRIATVGSNAQVYVDMNADGMKMSAKYLCIPQAQEMACRIQQ